MSDIVERLREQYAEQFKEEQPAEVIYRYQQERFEAADEIARLRAIRDELVAALSGCLAFIADEYTDAQASALDGHPIAKIARPVWDRGWGVIAIARGEQA